LQYITNWKVNNTSPLLSGTLWHEIGLFDAAIAQDVRLLPLIKTAACG